MEDRSCNTSNISAKNCLRHKQSVKKQAPCCRRCLWGGSRQYSRGFFSSVLFGKRDAIAKEVTHSSVSYSQQQIRW